MCVSLVIDGTNEFLRHWIVNPTLSSNGSPVGGIVGFLRSVGKLASETSCDKIYVCWDGQGGSAKRRGIFKEYKEGRKPLRANRTYEYSEEEKHNNNTWQMVQLKRILDHMPIIQVEVEDSEADDVIAQIVNDLYYETDEVVVIVSSDKDFFQLLRDRVLIHRPVQKETLNEEDLFERYQIHSRNFALFRAIVGGDKSDNITGIKGVGEKSFLKLFPFFSEDRDICIDEVIQHAKENEKKGKKYRMIAEGKEKITQNFSLMQLYSPMISISQSDFIEFQKGDNDGTFHFGIFTATMVRIGMEDISSLDSFVRHMKRISSNYKR